MNHEEAVKRIFGIAVDALGTDLTDLGWCDAPEFAAAAVEIMADRMAWLEAREVRLREALALAYSDCRVLAHAYKHDSRPPSAVVSRCLALNPNCTEAVASVAAGTEVKP